jgi:hypothetical protein
MKNHKEIWYFKVTQGDIYQKIKVWQVQMILDFVSSLVQVKNV